MVDYVLRLSERVVQFLVSEMRKLPLGQVIDDFRSIERQCKEQEQKHAEEQRAARLADARLLVAEDDARLDRTPRLDITEKKTGRRRAGTNRRNAALPAADSCELG